MNRAVTTRTIDEKAVTAGKVQSKYGSVIGNIKNVDGTCHEISLMELADILAPIITGSTNPSIPIGSPLYIPGQEYELNDHSFITRFTGTISAIPNFDMKTLLSNTIKLDQCVLKDVGGSWVYQSNPKAMTILGGSNITGHGGDLTVIPW